MANALTEDDDALLDELEDELEPGGRIVDYHSAELFPERWFDLVLVLRVDNSVLYSRLERRGYPERKLQENVEAEIMQVILDEAREAYREEIVIELPSNTIEDMESNLARTSAWLRQWRPQ
jgi:adenylate kinase